MILEELLPLFDESDAKKIPLYTQKISSIAYELTASIMRHNDNNTIQLQIDVLFLKEATDFIKKIEDKILSLLKQQHLLENKQDAETIGYFTNCLSYNLFSYDPKYDKTFLEYKNAYKNVMIICTGIPQFDDVKLCNKYDLQLALLEKTKLTIYDISNYSSTLSKYIKIMFSKKKDIYTLYDKLILKYKIFKSKIPDSAKNLPNFIDWIQNNDLIV